MGVLTVYGEAISYGSAWDYAGLPSPRISGYSIVSDRGLVRTSMESGAVRQRQKWTNGRRSIRMTVTIPRSKLNDLETFINECGFRWFRVGLVSEDSLAYELGVHTVRIKGPFSVEAVFGQNVDVVLSAEVM